MIVYTNENNKILETLKKIIDPLLILYICKY